MDDVLGMEVAVGVQAGVRLSGGYLISPPPDPPAPSLVPGPGRSLHALGSLPGHINELDHVEACVGHVQVVVETGALAPLCDDSKSRPGHEAHEQQDVDVTCLPAGRAEGIRAGRVNSNFLSIGNGAVHCCLLPSFPPWLSGGSGPDYGQIQ